MNVASWRSSLVLVALALAVNPALTAQTEGVPSSSTAGQAAALYRDVKALMLAAQLELTAAQVEKIVPVLQMISDQAAADEAADQASWQVVQKAADRVIAALLAGVQPPEGETAALDQVARERRQREEARAAMVASAAIQIQRMLTARQARRIETAAEQAERLARQARMEGARTPIEYLLRKLDEQAELMPDEYLRIREQRALEMAQAIEGEGPGVRRLAEALLRITDEVAEWSPQQYSQQRATLGQQLAEALGLPQEEDKDLIRYEEFISWITSEATVRALREFLANAKTSTESGEARP